MGRPRTLRRLTSLFGRHLLRRDGTRDPEESLSDLCALLLSARGEASGVALAAEILDQYAVLADADKAMFLGELADRFDPDPQAIVRAAIAHAHHGSAATLAELLDAVEPPRQELFRRLNQAPGATAHLVRLREDLMDLLPTNAELARIDNDLRHLLNSWFNRGFLVLESMTWSTSARVLERIIDYEAVHEIGDWDELRRRLEPPDRRCYAFLHPAMPDEPLVFVEVALTRGIPDSITSVLAREREPLAAEEADTAVFYSISNCQRGLRGVSFGHFLIKQVARDLARDHPGLTTFVTLSPVPELSSWIEQQAAAGDDSAAELVRLIADEAWLTDPDAADRHTELVNLLGARFFLQAKRSDGAPLDPVARFHLGNGAVLEQLHPRANLTAAGISDSVGLMVNYRYDLDAIEENHEAYTRGEIRTSPQIAAKAADAA